MTKEEMMLKAEAAKNVEELMTLAKENGLELSEESAKAYYEQFHKSGELSDAELDNVAGGNCHSADGRMVVTKYGCRCDHWACKHCGRSERIYGEVSNVPGHRCKDNDETAWKVICSTCQYCVYENGLWLCNNIKNIG